MKLPKDLESEECRKMLEDLCVKHEVNCPEPKVQLKQPIEDSIDCSIRSFRLVGRRLHACWTSLWETSSRTHSRAPRS